MRHIALLKVQPINIILFFTYHDTLKGREIEILSVSGIAWNTAYRHEIQLGEITWINAAIIMQKGHRFHHGVRFHEALHTSLDCRMAIFAREMIFCPAILAFIALNFMSTTSSAPTTSSASSHNTTAGRNLFIPVWNGSTKPFTLNLTSLRKDVGIRYDVPHTLTTLYFHLGFPIDSNSMRNTVRSARRYCKAQVEAGSEGPLPWDEDPFVEDLGWGAAINVISARPDHRLTWQLLEDITQGLWNYLILDEHFLEAEFEVMHGVLGRVGRGTVEAAPPLKQQR